MRRRSFLAALGASATLTVSGCLGSVGDALAPLARLGWVAVGNYHPEPQRCVVRIERENTVVHESEHEIAGKTDRATSGTVLKCTWGDEPGPYTLRGRVAGGEWADVVTDRVFADESPDCVIVEGRLFYQLAGASLRFESDGFSWWPQTWCDSVPSYRGGCAFANSTQ